MVALTNIVILVGIVATSAGLGFLLASIFMGAIDPAEEDEKAWLVTGGIFMTVFLITLYLLGNNVVWQVISP